jgi:hypothetical protein
MAEFGARGKSHCGLAEISNQDHVGELFELAAIRIHLPDAPCGSRSRGREDNVATVGRGPGVEVSARVISPKPCHPLVNAITDTCQKKRQQCDDDRSNNLAPLDFVKDVLGVRRTS